MCTRPWKQWVIAKRHNHEGKRNIINSQKAEKVQEQDARQNKFNRIISGIGTAANLATGGAGIVKSAAEIANIGANTAKTLEETKGIPSNIQNVQANTAKTIADTANTKAQTENVVAENERNVTRFQFEFQKLDTEQKERIVNLLERYQTAETTKEKANIEEEFYKTGWGDKLRRWNLSISNAIGIIKK